MSITRNFTQKSKNWCEPKPKPKINSEFKSILFGIEINKRLKFLTHKFLGLKS